MRYRWSQHEKGWGGMMLSAELRKSLEQATLKYMGSLSVAEAYLESRGITLEVAAGFGLGVVAEPMAGHDIFEGRLAIPYLTNSGPVNMKFRCIRYHDCKTVGCPKYIAWPGLGSNIYGVQAYAQAEDILCVTEGELDALTLNMLGIPAVGIPGADNWKAHWSDVLSDFAIVLVFSDGDKAGQDFAKRLIQEVHAINIRMPEGEDVNSMYLKEGPQYLRSRVKGVRR